MVHVVNASPQQLDISKAASTAEKARQVTASKNIAISYVSAISFVVFIFTVRNAIRTARQYYLRKSKALDVEYASTGAQLSAYGRLERFLDSPIPSRFLPGDCTYMKFLLTFLICAVNLICILIIDLSFKFIPQVADQLCRFFARRTGYIAMANMPYLYMLGGRHSLVGTLTGVSHTTLKWYHKVMGTIALTLMIVHAVAYANYYVKYKGGMAALHEEWNDPDIVLKVVSSSTILLFVSAVLYIPVIKPYCYEIFYVIHIAGAMTTLGGMWYHRVQYRNWTIATLAFFCFERFMRFSNQVFHFMRLRFYTRSPFIRASARSEANAVLISVPAPAHSWEAGQHFYLTFLGSEMYRTPWLLFQPHPFSVANCPKDGSGEMKFIIRKHKGMTKALFNAIERAGGARNVLVNVEGPFHSLHTDVSAYQQLAFIAGGSGITSVLSLFEKAIIDISKGVSRTKRIHLVWCIPTIHETRWMDDELSQARSVATANNVDLTIDLYVTQHKGDVDKEDARQEKTLENSGVSSAGEKSMSFDEKSAGSAENEGIADHTLNRQEIAQEINEIHEINDALGNARVHLSTRPVIAQVIQHTDASSRCLVVGCGPSRMTNDISRAAAKLAHVDELVFRFGY